jgi:PPOX class probable F420-dependent enzyme
MDATTMRRRVDSARVAHLATVGADARPHLVPVCFAVDADTVYSAVDHKPKRDTQLRRLDNLRATGHACLLVDQYGEDWSMLWWVRLDGRGRVTDNPREMALARAALGDKYDQYAVQPPGGPIIAVQVTRWSGWSAAG